jgi:hypothetical protein
LSSRPSQSLKRDEIVFSIGNTECRPGVAARRETLGEARKTDRSLIHPRD